MITIRAADSIYPSSWHANPVPRNIMLLFTFRLMIIAQVGAIVAALPKIINPLLLLWGIQCMQNEKQDYTLAVKRYPLNGLPFGYFLNTDRIPYSFGQ